MVVLSKFIALYDDEIKAKVCFEGLLLCELLYILKTPKHPVDPPQRHSSPRSIKRVSYEQLSKTPTMSSGTGIQELMAAETRASQIVAEARAARGDRMKQAK